MRFHRALILAAVLAAVAPAAAPAAPLTYSALSPDGRDLYVASQTDEEDGALTHFSVGAGGALTYVGCYGLPAGCEPSGFDEFIWPRGVVVSPDGRDVYVLGPDLGQYRRGADGRLTYVGKDTSGRLGNVRSLAISPDGRNLYAAGGDETVFRESRVLHFRRDTATGATAYAGCIGTDFWGGRGECATLPPGVVSTSGAMSIVVSPDSRHVYTTGWVGGVNEFSGVTAVTHFRAGADGALSFADCIGNGPSGCPELPAAASGRNLRMLSLALVPGGLSVGTVGTESETTLRFALGEGGELAFAGCTGRTAAPACAFTGTGSSTPATIQLLPPDEPTQFGAGLNARINTYGARYAVRWEYGPTTAYGLQLDLSSTSSDSGGWTRIEGSPRDIAPGRTYHYRLVVNTPAGPVYSPDATFTTLPYGPPQHPPTVESHQPLGNAGTGVAFAATVDGSGFPTRWWFEWGETQAYGRSTPPRDLSEADARTHSVKELVTGLVPGRQYFYRVVAENAAGRAEGHGSGVFTYAGPTAPVTPGPSPSPSPDPTASPSPAATASPSPAATASPSPPPSPDADAPRVPAGPLAASSLAPPSFSPIVTRASDPSAPRSTPRVSVSNRRIVVAVSEQTRIVIQRRAGKRWVRVTSFTATKTVRRTVKPGLYRVTVGTVKRQVRVR